MSFLEALEKRKQESDTSTWGNYDWGKPCRAVIAGMGGGPAAIVWTVGAHINMELKEYGTSAEDMGLEPEHAGIYVWEGRATYDGDGDLIEFIGNFRAPTQEEWELIKQNRCPWNDEDWKLKKVNNG